MNRDESTEKTETTAVVDRSTMLPNQADVSMGKRSQITKAAKRFERYGNVEDGQTLVSLIGDIAGGIGDKETHVVAARHKKAKS